MQAILTYSVLGVIQALYIPIWKSLVSFLIEGHRGKKKKGHRVVEIKEITHFMQHALIFSKLTAYHLICKSSVSNLDLNDVLIAHTAKPFYDRNMK